MGFTHTGRRTAAIAATLWLAAFGYADWPCEPQWTTFPSDRFTDTPTALVMFDDGHGPRLYAGGGSRLWRWTGMQWEQVEPQPPTSGTMIAFDDGTGPALYMQSNTAGVIRWRPSGWESVGNAHIPLGTLQVCDVGQGPQLFLYGPWVFIDGVPRGPVARWNGGAWEVFGTWPGSGSQPVPPLNLDCGYGLCVFDDGTGPALFFTCLFIDETDPLNRVSYFLMKCRGDAWEPVDTGGVHVAGQMFIFDDGAGPALWFGSGHCWDGQTWTTTGMAMKQFAVFDDGSGPHLYGARIKGTDQQSLIARWDGAAWVPLGEILPNYPVATTLLAATDPFSGRPKLYVGGNFNKVGPALPFQRIAAWNGKSWEPIGTDVDGVNHTFIALMPTAAPAPVGPALYAAAGYSDYPTLSQRLLRWDGQAWTCIGAPVQTAPYVPTIVAVVASTAGGVPRLYVTGSFTAIDDVSAPGFAMWDGTHWEAMPRRLGVYSALTRQEGGEEVVYFAGRSGGESCVLRWDGHVLTQLGQIAEPGYGPALVEYNGDLVLAMMIDTHDALRILRWDGFTWEVLHDFALGTLGCDYPYCWSHQWSAAVAQTSAGPVLYVFGDFIGADGAPDTKVVSWDGHHGHWGVDELPDLSLAEFIWFRRETLPPHDVLYAAGYFAINGVTGGLLRWDGADAELGADIPSNRLGDVATAPQPTFPGPATYVAGRLTAINGQPTASLARWGCPPQRRGDTDCSGQVDFADIDPFVTALGGPAAYRALHPACNWFNADANCDGHVTFADIDPFVSCLGGACAACP